MNIIKPAFLGILQALNLNKDQVVRVPKFQHTRNQPQARNLGKHSFTLSASADDYQEALNASADDHQEALKRFDLTLKSYEREKTRDVSENQPKKNYEADYNQELLKGYDREEWLATHKRFKGMVSEFKYNLITTNEEFTREQKETLDIQGDKHIYNLLENGDNNTVSEALSILVLS